MFTLLNARIYCCNAGHTVFIRTLSTSQLKEYYDALKVGRSSTPKEIKASFLKLSKVYHPDNRVTGSHIKFVKLKEAYDAIKDGPPSVSSTSTYQQNTEKDYDLSHRAYARYKEREYRYQSPYDNPEYGFGGPYAKSQKPWEEMMRDRAYRKGKQQEGFGGRAGRSMTSLTLLLGAISWIVMYSSVLLIWDYNDNVKNSYVKHRAKHREDYVSFDSYMRKREEQRRLRRAGFHEYEPKEGEEPLRKRRSASKPEISETPSEAVAPSREEPKDFKM